MKARGCGSINQDEYDTLITDLSAPTMVTMTLMYTDDGTYSEDVIVHIKRSVTLGDLLRQIHTVFDKGSSTGKPFTSIIFRGLRLVGPDRWKVLDDHD